MAVARRTQQERRDATKERLVDATLEALVEVGYHRTSINEICTRAGTSHGGLFRHYASRLDLVADAYRAATDRQITTFIERFADELVEQVRDQGDDHVRWAVTELHRVMTGPQSIAIHELHAAARTDGELRDRLSPVLRDQMRLIREKASSNPLAAEFPMERYLLAVGFFIHTFTGLGTISAIVPSDEYDQACIGLAVEFAHTLQVPGPGTLPSG